MVAQGVKSYRASQFLLPLPRRPSVPGGHTFLTFSILHTSFGISSGEEDYTHGIIWRRRACPPPGIGRRQGHRRPANQEVRDMTLTAWITALAMVSTVTLTGVAFAQQPTAQPQTPDPVQERGTGVSMTNPYGSDGKPITTSNLPIVERPTGTSLTVPYSADGKPFTQSTNLGQR